MSDNPTNRFAAERSISRDIRSKVAALNEAIEGACEAGLSVNFSIGQSTVPRVKTTISKVWIEKQIATIFMSVEL